tara:strand:+ start:139 stop:885 length:747 start_codon:yes stop_codon:yes gene_type:complete
MSLDKIIFLNSLPRAGNTLLGAVLNKNKNIKATPNSITVEIINQLIELKNNQIFKNFPDHKSLDNVIKCVFNNYYKDWKVKYIIERSNWGTPYNLNLLKQIIKKPKFIILVRPTIECIASFAKLQIENKIYTKQNIPLYVDQIMDKNYGVIGKSLWGIENIINNNEDYKIFYYRDLINDTDNFLKNLGKFIGLKLKKPLTLNQFSVNNVRYQDKFLIKNLHKIKTNWNYKNNYDIERYLPKEVIKKWM